MRAAEPARLSASRVRRVHNVIRDEEEGLQKLRQPAQGGGLVVLFWGEGAVKEDGSSVHDGHAAVAFAAGGIYF